MKTERKIIINHAENEISLAEKCALLWREIDSRRYEFHQFLHQKKVGIVWWTQTLHDYSKNWKVADIENEVNVYNKKTWTWWWDWLFTDISYKETWLAFQKSKSRLAEVLPILANDESPPDPLKITVPIYEQIQNLQDQQLINLQNVFFQLNAPSSLQIILRDLAGYVKNLWQLINPKVIKISSPTAQEKSQPSSEIAKIEGSDNMLRITPHRFLVSQPAPQRDEKAKNITSLEYAPLYVSYASLCVFLNLSVGKTTLNQIEINLELLIKNAHKAAANTKVPEIFALLDTYQSTLKHIGAKKLANLPCAPIPMTNELKLACAQKVDVDARNKIQAFLDEDNKINQQLNESKMRQEKLQQDAVPLRIINAFQFAEYFATLGVSWENLSSPITQEQMEKYYKQKARQVHPDKAITKKDFISEDVQENLRQENEREFHLLSMFRQHIKELFNSYGDKPVVISFKKMTPDENNIIAKSFRLGQLKLNLLELTLEKTRVIELLLQYDSSFSEKENLVTQKMIDSAEESQYLSELEVLESQKILPLEQQYFDILKKLENIELEAKSIRTYRNNYIDHHVGSDSKSTTSSKPIIALLPIGKGTDTTFMSIDVKLQTDSVGDSVIPLRFAKRARAKKIRELCEAKRRLKKTEKENEILKQTTYSEALENFSKILTSLSFPQHDKEVVYKEIDYLKNILKENNEFGLVELERLYLLFVKQYRLTSSLPAPSRLSMFGDCMEKGLEAIANLNFSDSAPSASSNVSLSNDLKSDVSVKTDLPGSVPQTVGFYASFTEEAALAGQKSDLKQAGAAPKKPSAQSIFTAGAEQPVVASDSSAKEDAKNSVAKK